jgi:hypothetical protein
MVRAREAQVLPRSRLHGCERRLLAVSLAVIAGFSLAGCEKLSGDAVVLAKEHIAAAPEMAKTPNAQPAPSPNEESRPIGDDEITVDGYVMEPDVRGTSRDPRALKDEQWLVKVRMIQDGRTFNVQAEQAQFDKLKEGDRVQVRYRFGKYTKTVWAAEIEEIKK